MTEILVDSPVRLIRSSSRSVTGTVPGLGRYESTLERDMMELIRFDRAVSRFVPQPLTVDYRGTDGRARTYTPDGLIHYHHQETHLPPVLFEVKFREDFRKDWKTYLPKFRAAKAYCRDRGWRFLTTSKDPANYLSRLAAHYLTYSSRPIDR